MRSTIEQKGQHAVPVVCDLADIAGVRRAAAEIAALRLPIAGLINNAGIMQMRPSRNTLGWDMTFATNHLGPFALTEALIEHLGDGARVVFIASGVEDPERKPAKLAGFRGGRYISAEASARGEWLPGGSRMPGADAYATSKQCLLATAFEFAREHPQLRVNAIEPGFMPGTGLGRDAPAILRFVSRYILGPIVPRMKYGSTPARAARVISAVVTDSSGQTGMYFDERGRPMRGSALVSDPAFRARVVAETRALLASVAMKIEAEV